MESSYVKVDCGFEMDGAHNACFFMSLKKALSDIGHSAAQWSYATFLNAGKWAYDQKKNQMVDTFTDETNLNTLAIALDVEIRVFAETTPGTYRLGNLFGWPGSKVVRIVKIYNQAHFVHLMEDDATIARRLHQEDMWMLRDAMHQEEQDRKLAQKIWLADLISA